MDKHVMAITKVNLKNIKVPYFVTFLIFITILVQTFVYTIVAFASERAGSQLFISSGSYLWLLIILAAIFIPAKNFRRIVNLGGKRNSFFWGSMIAYAVLAGAVSLMNTVCFYTVEKFFESTKYFVSLDSYMANTSLLDSNYVNVNLIELFGWTSHGIFFAFIQQFAFLLLLAAVTHTLTTAQGKWYGWATNLAIAAVLAVFIPIAPLRSVMMWFFKLIIFNSNAFLQIAVCLILGIAIFALSKPMLSRKAI